VAARQAEADAQRRFTCVTGGSTNVALQDGDEGAKIAPALGGVFHILDAVMRVRMDYLLPKRFEAAARRDHLVQDLGAIGVLGYQPFESLNLAANFSQADDERIFLVLRVNMSHVP